MNWQRAGPSRPRPLEPLIISSSARSNERARGKGKHLLGHSDEHRSVLQPLKITSSNRKGSFGHCENTNIKSELRKDSTKTGIISEGKYQNNFASSSRSSQYTNKALEPIKIQKPASNDRNSNWKSRSNSSAPADKKDDDTNVLRCMKPLRLVRKEPQDYGMTSKSFRQHDKSVYSTNPGQQTAFIEDKVLIPLRQDYRKKDDFIKSNQTALEPLSLKIAHRDKFTVDSMEESIDQTRTFAKLDHPKHAIHILCNDLKAMKPCTNENGTAMGTFIHLKRPTVFVHFVGRIVGIEEKDHKVRWLIDDGSEVVAVRHSYDPRPPIQHQELDGPAIVDKGKRRAIDQESFIGIPAEYIRPKTPPPKSSRKTKNEAIVQATLNCQQFERTYKHLSICSIANVVGRVESWFEGEMIVQVDRIIPEGVWKDSKEVRSLREGYIELLYDSNEEIRHINHALDLASTEYAKQQEQIQIESINSDINSAKRKLSPTEGEVTMIEKPNALKEILEPQQNNPIIDQETHLSSTFSTQPHSARRLRDFRKLPDDQFTSDLLRIYVQKHISDHCRVGWMDNLPPAFTIDYLQRVTDLRLLANRVVEVALKKREAKRRKLAKNKSSKECISTSASTNDTGKVERLFKSVIGNIQEDGMIVGNRKEIMEPYPPFNGQKPEDEKIAKLFKRKGYLDWEESGIKQSEPIHLTGDFVTAKQQMHLTNTTTVIADTSMMIWQGKTNLKNESKESYQLVTAELIAIPLVNLIELRFHQEEIEENHKDTQKEIFSLLNRISISKLKDRLNSYDDQWKNIREESIIDSIEYLKRNVHLLYYK